MALDAQESKSDFIVNCIRTCIGNTPKPQIIDIPRKGCIPVFTLQAACGSFGYDQTVECEGWIDASHVLKFPDSKRHFVVHAKGESMLPEIDDGDLCIFEWNHETNLCAINHKIVLSEYEGIDPVYQGSYTIKQLVYPYATQGRETTAPANEVRLVSLNSQYKNIDIDLSDSPSFRIVGLYIGKI